MGLRIYDIHLSFGKRSSSMWEESDLIIFDSNVKSGTMTGYGRSRCPDDWFRSTVFCFLCLIHGTIMTLSTMEVWTGSGSLVREWCVCDLEGRERTFILLILNSYWESLRWLFVIVWIHFTVTNSRHRHKAIKATPPSVIAMWVSQLNIVGDNPFVYSSLLCALIIFLHFGHLMSTKGQTNARWHQWMMGEMGRDSPIQMTHMAFVRREAEPFEVPRPQWMHQQV
jgi:hypothetical protein